MFREEMKQKLSNIFGLKKTTFDAASVNSSSGTFEQDTMFIEINECQSRITNGMAFAKVTGAIVVFSQMDRLPFGFFNKKIQLASYADTKDFFFFDIDINPISSPARIQNITERRVRFVYLYKAQYDPSQGHITSVNLEEQS